MLNRLSLTAMIAGLRERRFSSLELVDAHLAEIERSNPQVNAFVAVYADQARAEARQPKPGALSGIPVTVKDSFDVAGEPTYCGSRFRLGHKAAHDATAVARLRAAGAIILGKTNCPEFLSNYETDNFITGRTNNPRNLTLTPGGSSGGEAAAIAACCSPGGIGSDGGGSIRLPAHFCSIAGLKPTPGRVSAAGHFPVICHPGGLLGVAGPMARTVADVRLLFEVLSGYDIADPFSAPVPMSSDNTAGARIGVMRQFYHVPVEQACADAVEVAARRFAQAGFPVAEFVPRGLERAPNLWAFFFSELSVPFTRELLAGREDEAHWTGTEFYHRLKDRPEPTGRQVVENLAARDAMRRFFLEQMRDVDVILTPVAGVTAFPHRTRRFPTPGGEIGLFQATMPLVWANLLGLPALAVPLTTTAGVQLVGRPWEEPLLLALGEALTAGLLRQDSL
jgi:Asp-tRNA(Asn)/Glu-tRNA(Gln) amidotransferase A subunit family amidase